jgi:hypothetical protein
MTIIRIHSFVRRVASRYEQNEVGGHLAANFSTRNSFVELILKDIFEVGGQWSTRRRKRPRRKAVEFFRAAAKVGGHLAANFAIRNSLDSLMLRHKSQVGGQFGSCGGRTGRGAAAFEILPNRHPTFLGTIRCRIPSKMCSLQLPAGHLTSMPFVDQT